MKGEERRIVEGKDEVLEVMVRTLGRIGEE